MMNNTILGNPLLGNVFQNSQLPPLNERKSVKEKDPWQKAVMDSFERIGIEQFEENLRFHNYYRMVDGKMSYQELSEVIPHLKNFQELLSGVGVPSFLKHYDILGIILNLLIGKYIDLQDKFHVTDTGEIAQNEFQRFKTEEIQENLKALINNEISMHLATMGLNPEGQQFQSEEEQQMFISKLEQEKKKLTPKDTENDSKKSFKTIGTQWGEGTLDHDRIRFNLMKYEKAEFKDKFLTGRCFRHYKIGYTSYKPVTWSPINTFIPREIETERAQDGEFIGRVQIYTPAETIRIYGHEMTAAQQKELLGGNKDWRDFGGTDYSSGRTYSAADAVQNNFGISAKVPFSNFQDYEFMTHLEDSLGYPIATRTVLDGNGGEQSFPSYIPRLRRLNPTTYSWHSKVLNDNFTPREDLCQVTEVFFQAQDLWGYLTYETETGLIKVEEVTEDILKDFIRENNIKQKFKEVFRKPEEIGEFEVNTIIWTYRPVTYEGVKIQSPHLKEPIYLYCRPCEHQIEGDGPFSKLLPVAGIIGKAYAPKIEPYQASYNLCMNQMYQMMEKEIGPFLLMSLDLIHSEFQNEGDPEDALVNVRRLAREIGFVPGVAPQNTEGGGKNPMTVFDISFTQNIQSRISIAEFCQRKAYEAIGVNPVSMSQAPKYTTSSGVQISNEISYSQIAEIYEDFTAYNQGALELQLSIAQYCQSNSKDDTLFYTKSDASLEYLKLSDPNFPLRKIGLIPAVDGRKRKELEDFKNFLLNNNTLSSDTLELAKLFASDAMSEIIDITRVERENREQAELEKYNRDQSLIAQKSEADQKLLETEMQRREESKQRDRDNEIRVATISAIGRASDKHSDVEGFQEIARQSELALKAEGIQNDQELKAKEFTRKEKADADRNNNATEKLRLEAEKLKVKREEIRSKNYVATVNRP